jgi:hypothetical protein
MRKTKSAARKNPPTKRPKRAEPITLKRVERWLEEYQYGFHDRQIGFDRRLMTVAPSIHAVLRGYRRAQSCDGAFLVDAATRAVGTPYGDFGRDHRRRMVVCDWMIRGVLPIWLDRLPNWCAARTCADQLRRSSPFQWACQMVEALAVLAPAWASLDEAARDMGTASERASIHVARERATAAMRHASKSLAADLAEVHERNGDNWACHMMVWEMVAGLDGSVAAATISDLLDVLIAVQPGDSQRSVADRCVWRLPAKRKAA